MKANLGINFKRIYFDPKISRSFNGFSQQSQQWWRVGDSGDSDWISCSSSRVATGHAAFGPPLNKHVHMFWQSGALWHLSVSCELLLNTIPWWFRIYQLDWGEQAGGCLLGWKSVWHLPFTVCAILILSKRLWESVLRGSLNACRRLSALVCINCHPSDGMLIFVRVTNFEIHAW